MSSTGRRVVLLVLGVTLGYMLLAMASYAGVLPCSASSSHLSAFDGSSDYGLAYHDSKGFFKDVPQKDWILQKQRQKDVLTRVTVTKPDEPHRWYQNNFEPTFTCQHERRIGGLGDGPKWVCDPHRIDPNNCLVYSIGSNNNFMFEEAVLREISPACEIHTFDPTVGDHPSNKPNNVHFHPWGLGNATGTSKIRGKIHNVKTMADIRKELNHESRTVDIFKIDCEGCEWSTVEGWFSAMPHRQIQVELHSGTLNGDAENFMNNLQGRGYAVFHKESNTRGCKGSCIEYSFLHLGSTFFA